MPPQLLYDISGIDLNNVIYDQDAIRQVIPPDGIENLLDNIGIPYSGLNLSLSEGALISAADGEIFIVDSGSHGVITA